MRILVAVALIAVGLAGCAETQPPIEDDTEPHIDPAPTIELTPDGLAAAGLTVDAGELLAKLNSFATQFPQRKGNHADHIASRDWLASEYAAMGYEVWRQEFTNGIDQENICALHWGTDPLKWVVVGGHYDMTTTGSSHDEFSQGMYDDGSGTIMTLEMARVYAGTATDFTIAFCAFDGEERGLQGSGAVAAALSEGNTSINGQSYTVTLAGMLDLDMFGLNWPGIDAPIFFDDNSPELQAFVRGYAKALGIPDDRIEFHGITLGRSDYAHFFGLGVPTGFYISDFEQWQLPGDLPVTMECLPMDLRCTSYPFWHVADTWETMVLMAGSEENLEAGFQVATDLALGTLAFLADADSLKTGVQK